MQAPLSALLLCNDDQSLSVIDRTFEEYSVSTYFCASGESAQASADNRKFDLLMLDFDEPEAHKLVDFRAVDLWGYPYGLIVNEKRTVFRHAVHFPAIASFLENNVKNPLANVSVKDISVTGICLEADTVVSKDATVFIDFELPDSHAPVSAIGKVMWSDNQGRIGVQFRFIPPLEQEQLRAWLSNHCPWDVELQPKSFGNLHAVAVPKRIQ